MSPKRLSQIPERPRRVHRRVDSGRVLRCGIVALAFAVLACGAQRDERADRAPHSGSMPAKQNNSGAPAPNPHRYDSPFRNARADVAYVGDATCALCHAEIVETFRGHGMARSFALVDGAKVLGDWSGTKSVRHAASGYTYTMTMRDGRHVVVESRADSTGREIHRIEKEVGAIVGSGDNDQAFVYEEDGGWYLLPIEWYTTKAIWDMAPGFDGADQERWKRRLLPGCIGCHASAPDYIADSGHRYRDPMPAAIGCERCHGPGALHADARMTGAAGVSTEGFDSTIVNPARLDAARQIDVCAQCHLQGDVRRPRPGCGDFDFRPALDLDDFRVTHVPAIEDTIEFGFVRHVERMAQSRCYTESDSMTCTTCHNPHETSRGHGPRQWRDACLQCHAETECPECAGSSGGAAANANGGAHNEGAMGHDCVACHMRRSEPYDLRHVTITDHWIRKRVEPATTHAATRMIARAGVPLVRFADGGAAVDTSAFDLVELGISHVAVNQDARAVDLLENGIARGARWSEGFLQLAIALGSSGRQQDALAMLDSAAHRAPESAEAAFRVGQTSLAAGRPLDAVAKLRAGLALYADDALAWTNLAIALDAADSLDAAIDAATRAVAIHAGSDAAQRTLGRVLAKRGRRADAEAPLREALRLSPDDLDTWMTLGDLLGRESRFEDAAAAFERATRLAPGATAPLGNLALALAASGQTSRARSILETVLAREPDNQKARALLARIAEGDPFLEPRTP
ncbi:MAG: tetratricopeptide repeat protein [bacterium]